MLRSGSLSDVQFMVECLKSVFMSSGEIRVFPTEHLSWDNVFFFLHLLKLVCEIFP